MISEAVVDVAKVHLPKRTLAYIRNVGPYMGDTQLFGKLFMKVLISMEARGLMRPDTEAITVYHDDPKTTPPKEQRISVGFTVPEGTAPEAGIEILELPESNYVVGAFEIHPDEYGDAWARTMSYIEENGLTPSGGPMFESYKNDPKTHEDGKHIVEICIAVV